MISIEAYRAAIGKHNRRKIPVIGKMATLSITEVSTLLLLSFVLSFLPIIILPLICITCDLILPLIILSTSMCFICISTDLIAIHFCRHMNNVNAAKTSFLMYNRTARFCYFIESQSSATNVNSRKLVKILMRFLQHLLSCLCIIFISISCILIGIDVISRMNNVNNIEFHPTVSHDLECYNVSFLKLLQLLVHGDVESNPGPVGNRSTQKGRQKKKTTFNFNRKKEDKITLDPISHNVDPIVLNESCDPKHVDTSTQNDVMCVMLNNDDAVTPDIVDETDKSMDIDPIVLDENCDAKLVDTSTQNDVICVSCNKNITITDPTCNTIRCVHCKATSKVSKLKPAVTPDIVDETDESMDIDPIVLDENCDAKHVDTSSPIELRNKKSIVQSDIRKVKCDAIVNAGPVTNNVETPKGKGGRPKKTGFKGFPKKLNFSKLDTVTNVWIDMGDEEFRTHHYNIKLCIFKSITIVLIILTWSLNTIRLRHVHVN